VGKGLAPPFDTPYGRNAVLTGDQGVSLTVEAAPGGEAMCRS